MRFQWTIRDILWLTLCAAFAIAWLINVAENRRLRKPPGFGDVRPDSLLKYPMSVGNTAPLHMQFGSGKGDATRY